MIKRVLRGPGVVRPNVELTGGVSLSRFAGSTSLAEAVQVSMECSVSPKIYGFVFHTAGFCWHRFLDGELSMADTYKRWKRRDVCAFFCDEDPISPKGDNKSSARLATFWVVWHVVSCTLGLFFDRYTCGATCAMSTCSVLCTLREACAPKLHSDICPE